jgi:hypothetical protein
LQLSHVNAEGNEISNVAIEPKNRGTRGNRCLGLWIKDISITKSRLRSIYS